MMMYKCIRVIEKKHIKSNSSKMMPFSMSFRSLSFFYQHTCTHVCTTYYLYLYGLTNKISKMWSYNFEWGANAYRKLPYYKILLYMSFSVDFFCCWEQEKKSFVRGLLTKIHFEYTEFVACDYDYDYVCAWKWIFILSHRLEFCLHFLVHHFYSQPT